MLKQIIKQESHRSPLEAQIEAGTYFANLSSALKLICFRKAKQVEKEKVILEIISDFDKLTKNYKIVKLK